MITIVVEICINRAWFLKENIVLKFELPHIPEVNFILSILKTKCILLILFVLYKFTALSYAKVVSGSLPGGARNNI